MTAKSYITILNLLSMLCLVLSVPTLAQTGAKKQLQAKANEKETSKAGEADSLAAQRRDFAISLVISLAEEARSYHDLALRPRVLARAADTLWDADSDTARTLFHRAWEAAEKGDAEEVTIKTKDNPPPMVLAMRRTSGRDLRSEVLGLAARHDRALGEEFLNKLKAETTRELADSRNDASTRNPVDSWSLSEATVKRLLLARQLLDDGQTERALEIAAPVLNEVNANSIGFLSVLRLRRPEAADQRFAFLLARVEFDPSSDANTASGLSSYVFTPGLYVTFNADGNSRWTQPEEAAAAPNLPAALRDRFFQVAASILLRPVPPSDQDFTSSGRTGKYMVIKRLLPLFDQYAADIASALRSQLTALAGDASKRVIDDSPLVTQGVQPEETAEDALGKIQDRLDRARTSTERDSICTDAAVALANQGDARAQDLADKIDDSQRRAQVRRYVDFKLVQFAIQKKEASDVARLAKAGQLTHMQRAWAYTQAARLLMKTERPRSLEFLDEAANEARRIDANDPDRARALISVATQFVTADRVRAWEILGEAVKAANAAERFTGENVQLQFAMPTKGGLKMTSIGGEEFGLSGVLRSLAKDDLFRSNDLVKSIKNDAPRATATLAIARAVLEK